MYLVTNRPYGLLKVFSFRSKGPTNCETKPLKEETESDALLGKIFNWTMKTLEVSREKIWESYKAESDYQQNLQWHILEDIGIISKALWRKTILNKEIMLSPIII